MVIEMKRGAIVKKKARQVIVWMPVDLIRGMDRAVGVLDLDRSKFIRQAVREKCGVKS